MIAPLKRGVLFSFKIIDRKIQTMYRGFSFSIVKIPMNPFIYGKIIRKY
jgi:hypothetical protein